MRYNLPRGLTPKLLPLCVASALAGLAPSAANAVTMLDATAEYSLGGGGTTTVSDSSADTTIDPSVDIIPYVSDSSGNSVFFHVYGNSNNVFGSRSSGEGVFTAEGTFLLTETFNNSGPAGEFFLDFSVDAGELNVNCSNSGQFCAAGQNGSAAYSIQIKVDSATVASSTASVSLTDAGSTVTGPGAGEFMLNGVNTSTGDQNAFYSWNTTSFLTSLGVLGTGAHTLTYEMVTTAIGNFGGGGGDCYGGYNGGQVVNEQDGNANGDGEEPRVLEAAVNGSESACTTGGARARSGDPFNINGPSTNDPAVTIFTGIPNGQPGGGGLVPAAVPEPASAVLLGLGMAGLGFARRRKTPASRD